MGDEDSTALVQMSSGIADAGMKDLGKNRPVPLPVQALDHAVGYLMAAAAIRGLTNRLKTGAGCQARTSLARMAAMLISQPVAPTCEAIAPETQNDLSENVEETAWGCSPDQATRRCKRSAVAMGFARKQVRKRGSEVVGARVSGERRTTNDKRQTTNDKRRTVNRER